MTDRELLELAAKAAGYGVEWDAGESCFWGYYPDEIRDVDCPWNPLTDDGDSRRLQVALSIDLRFGVSEHFGPYAHARTEVRRGGVTDFYESCLPMGLLPDANETARRAVLEVAAAIGQSMS